MAATEPMQVNTSPLSEMEVISEIVFFWKGYYFEEASDLVNS